VEDREDLGALFTRVSRRLIEAERPLLAARGLTMWGYILLSQLVRGPAPTQLTLAAAIGYDKTRLIGLLDELERDGLVTRGPDPADRRARHVLLTETGRARLCDLERRLRDAEDQLLAPLEPDERDALRALLQRLAVHSDGSGSACQVAAEIEAGGTC
jgi:DNA-binding MarR family transcriptional regulator